MAEAQATCKLHNMVIVQAAQLAPCKKSRAIAQEPVPGVWALPGRKTCTTDELKAIAKRNDWKLTF